MALPLGQINDAALRILAASMTTIWQNPANPGLDFLSKDFVKQEGYTPFSQQYPISQNVLQYPVAAPFANPRARLPQIDGMGTITQMIKPFELKVPLDDVTMDEWEEQTLVLRTFGQDFAGQSSASYENERWAARMQYGKLAISNRIEVNTMNLIESCSLITPEDNAVAIANTFARNSPTTVTELSETNWGYVDLSQAAFVSGDRYWLDTANPAAPVINVGAKPVQDVQVMIKTVKRFGGGGVKYFVMSPMALAAYQADFAANYADLAKNTVVTVGGNAQIEIPVHLMELGWSQIGYVHDFSNNYALIPVFAGSSVKYKDWTDANTLKDFLPDYQYCFPVPMVPTIGQKFTYVNLKRVKDQRVPFPINIYEDSESGDRCGSILHRGYMYPRVNPNALVFWRVDGVD